MLNNGWSAQKLTLNITKISLSVIEALFFWMIVDKVNYSYILWARVSSICQILHAHFLSVHYALWNYAWYLAARTKARQVSTGFLWLYVIGCIEKQEDVFKVAFQWNALTQDISCCVPTYTHHPTPPHCSYSPPTPVIPLSLTCPGSSRKADTSLGHTRREGMLQSSLIIVSKARLVCAVADIFKRERGREYCVLIEGRREK